MLFNNITEIRSILPTSRWNDLNKLASLLEEEEQNSLIPVLGMELYRKLQDEYNKIVNASGDITPLAIAKSIHTPSTEFPSLDKQLPILRTCQRITLYKVLANNSGLFSLSFNEGGGLNSSVAENYDEANEKAMQRYVKDAFNKAHRSTDALLKLLEADAQGEHTYTDKWKHSRYFFRQGGLLFTTAVSLQEFLNIDESRERYIQLVPRIRYAQDVYIRPRIGAKLLNALIDLKYTPALGGSPTENGEKVNGQMVNGLLPSVLSALALYVESSEKSMARPLSFNEGEMQIELARQYIKQHPDDFADYYCPELAGILPPPAPSDSTVPSGSPAGPTRVDPPSHHPIPPHHDPYVLDLGALTHS